MLLVVRYDASSSVSMPGCFQQPDGPRLYDHVLRHIGENDAARIAESYLVPDFEDRLATVRQQHRRYPLLPFRVRILCVKFHLFSPVFIERHLELQKVVYVILFAHPKRFGILDSLGRENCSHPEQNRTTIAARAFLTFRTILLKNGFFCCCGMRQKETSEKFPASGKSSFDPGRNLTYNKKRKAGHTITAILGLYPWQPD